MLSKSHRRTLTFTVLATLVAALLLVGVFGWLPERVDLDVGPGDADYVSGLSEDWRFENGRTWREMRHQGRLAVPLTIQGPGLLTITLARARPIETRFKVIFGDGTFDDIRLPATPNFIELYFKIRNGPAETDIRLTTEGPKGEEAPIRIDKIQWKGQRMRPQAPLGLGILGLWIVSFLTFLVAGARIRKAVLGTVLVALVFAPVPPIFGFDSFSRLHLIRKVAWVAPFGLAAVLVARLVQGRTHAAISSLFYFALLAKASLVFHPSYSFVDLPIHRTLVELVFHRGPVDFWTRLPEYQVIHNVGVAPLGGSYVAFPYPSLFYFLANAGNVPAHDPEFWMKLGGALAGALALFPVAALARRFSSAPRADLLACVAYLSVPALTRSLLVMEYSALVGHLLDLVAIAYLARVGLDLSSGGRKFAATALLSLSLVAYTSGFVHLGLLIAWTLVLAAPLGGLSRGNGLRLAGVGLLALVLAVVSYPPRTWRNVIHAATSAETPDTPAKPSEGRMDAPLTRGRLFLGAPLIILGLVGVGETLRRRSEPSAHSPLGVGPQRSIQEKSPQYLVLAAWLAAGVTAYVLRFTFHDLFLYQKELYFVAGLLAIGEGVFLAKLATRDRWGKVAATVLLLITFAAYGFAMRGTFPGFYTKYLFLA